MLRYVNFYFIIVLIALISSCSEDDTNQPSVDPNNSNITIWTGANVTFEKLGGSDPNLEQNQDRLTNNVWITRENNGGQIFNIQNESSASKSNSPLGTEWAIGTIDQLANLNFNSFRTAVGSPKDVVGKNLVLHLIADDIYLDVRFSSWDSSKEGGFSYERTTAN